MTATPAAVLNFNESTAVDGIPHSSRDTRRVGAAEPVSAVAGVVDPLGAGGARGPGGGPWTMTVDLLAWREADGPVVAEPLTLRKEEVGDAELRRLQAAIRPDAVTRFRARVGPPGRDGRRALLEEVLGPAEDAELAAVLAELQKPVVREDPRFGRLTFDRRFETWQGRAVWAGDRVTLTLEAGGGKDVDAALGTARALWDDEAAWAARVTDYAADALLDAKNDNWLGEDESALTAEQFVARLTPQEVVAAPGGEFTVWFDDGDLFWGHAVCIGGTLSDGPTFADTPG